MPRHEQYGGRRAPDLSTSAAADPGIGGLLSDDDLSQMGKGATVDPNAFAGGLLGDFGPFFYDDSPHAAPGRILLPPPRPEIDLPIEDVGHAYRAFGFDPAGKKHLGTAFQSPSHFRDVPIGLKMGWGIGKLTEEWRERGVLPDHWAADAVRHTGAAYELSRRLGPQRAREILNAHENWAPSEAGDRIMDLSNNDLGIRMRQDPANAGRPWQDVVLEAYEKGSLRMSPYKISDPAPRSQEDSSYASRSWSDVFRGAYGKGAR